MNLSPTDQAMINNIKTQFDVAKMEFNKNARYIALEYASKYSTSPKSLLEDAQEIYDWIIKIVPSQE